MEPIKLRNLKRGEFFTRKPIAEPNERQVLIRGEYVRENKRYSCCHWDDVNREILLKGETIVYVGFTF